MIRERHKGAPSIAAVAAVVAQLSAAAEQRQRALQAYQLFLSFETTYQFYLSSETFRRQRSVATWTASKRWQRVRKRRHTDQEQPENWF